MGDGKPCTIHYLAQLNIPFAAHSIKYKLGRAVAAAPALALGAAGQLQNTEKRERKQEDFDPATNSN